MQIKLTDVDALEALNAKLDKLTKLQEVMKGINSIIRNKKLTDVDKSKVIMEQYNLSTETIEKLLHPQMSWHNPGFQRWELSNNNQEINRLKKRIKEVSQYQQSVQSVEDANGELPEFPFEQGRIVDNIPANRLQVFFAGKPSEDIRKKLKMNGFRWAPSNGAWQAYRNNYALEWAKRQFVLEGASCEN